MMNMIDVVSWVDVRSDLEKIAAPTLIFHSRRDGNAPIEAGRWVAEQIAGSTFVELDSANHILLENEPAWAAFRARARAFLN
jgi:pimeloyl-ACP methyl ester carboxylesterase